MEKEMRMQPIMLPKFRYDEVNLKYKEAKAETEKLKALIETKDREIEVLRRELAQLREDFDHALMDLQVKETFVEGGIVKEQYEAIIPKMTCKNEEKIALAKAIVQLIKDQQKERGNENGN